MAWQESDYIDPDSPAVFTLSGSDSIIVGAATELSIFSLINEMR